MLIMRATTAPASVRIMITVPTRPTTEAVSLKSPVTAMHNINMTMLVEKTASTIFAREARHGCRLPLRVDPQVLVREAAAQDPQMAEISPANRAGR